MKRYRQCNGVKFQKDKHRCTNTTQKPKDRGTWTPLRTERQRMWTGRVSSCCSASGTRNVTLVTDSAIMWLIRYICYFIFVELVFAYHNNCVTKKYYYVRVCDSPFFIAITANTYVCDVRNVTGKQNDRVISKGFWYFVHSSGSPEFTPGF